MAYLLGGLFGVWAAAIAVAPGVADEGVVGGACGGDSAGVVDRACGRGGGSRCSLATALLLPPLPIAIGDSGPHICLAVRGARACSRGRFGGRVADRSVGGRVAAGRALRRVVGERRFGGLVLGVDGGGGQSGPRRRCSGFRFVCTFSRAQRPGASSIRHSVLDRASGRRCLRASISIFNFRRRRDTGRSSSGWIPGVYRRAQGFFYEASTLGNFCAFFLVMIAVAFSRPRDRIAGLADGARGGRRDVLRGAGALVLARIADLRRDRARGADVAATGGGCASARLAVAAAVAAVVTWQVFPTFAQMYWLRLSATAEYLFSATEGVLSGRVASWRTLIGWIAGASVADDLRHRVQDAAVHRLSRRARSSPITCTSAC